MNRHTLSFKESILALYAVSEELMASTMGVSIAGGVIVAPLGRMDHSG